MPLKNYKFWFVRSQFVFRIFTIFLFVLILSLIAYADDVVVENGKFGIGTLSPDADFEILGDQSAVDEELMIFGRADEAVEGRIIYRGNNPYVNMIGIGTKTNHELLLETNSIPRMTIGTTGNVGIGTTNPGSKLEVSGTIRGSQFQDGQDTSYFINPAGTETSLAVAGNVGIGTTGASTKLSIKQASNDETQGIRLTDAGGSNYGSMYYNGGLILQSTGNGFISLEDGGNVGIGTTSPASPAGVNRFLEIKDATHAGIVLHDTAANPWDIYNNDGSLRVQYNGGTGGMTINILGNVGIGTSSPGRKLTVVGDLSLDGNTNSLFFDNSAGSIDYQIYEDSSNRLRIGNAADANIFTLDSSSNVGIGTTNPTDKLRIVNQDTASDIIGLHVINDELQNWGLRISGSSTYGIALTANPDDTCQDQGTNALCSINDYAEMMEFSEEPEDSDVVVIDIDNPGMLKVSTKPYDNLVAGIASENPAMVIGSYGITIRGWDKNTTNEDGSYRYPLAIAGRKLIKVSDENGEIMPGDLLVTSSERGKAMKCDKKEYLQKCIGAIIGKSMTPAGDNELVLALVISQ